VVALADLVSEVRKVKHPMDAGIRAQQGIEW
jgi:cob(I)alamin adenosyltransferase